MRVRRILAASAACAAAIAAAPGAGAQQQDLSAECGRACLEALVDEYLAALAANDPSRLTLADDVRFTEQGVELEVGQGLWRTADGIGTYRHIFADPEMGQVGAYMSVREHGQPAMLELRLKREPGGAISEIETLVIRNAAQVIRMEEGGYPLPLWTTPVPEEERLTREQLARAANSYFTALENQDGRGVYAFSDDCNRLENSSYTTNAGGTSFEGSLDDAPTMAELNIGALGCTEQFETGNFAIDTELHGRRFPVIDIERGAVFAWVFFDHDGKSKTITMADGSTRNTRNNLWTWQMGESFKIERGLITHIEAWMVEAQYHADGGWTDFDRRHYGIVDAGNIGK
jgi:hypothetical protein